MARSAKHRAWRSKLSKGESYRGWVFFSLYLLVFPFLMAGVQWVFDEKWGFFLNDATANVLYYSVTAVLVLLVFWNFLKQGFFLLLDFLPENFFAGLAGLGFFFLLRFFTGFLPLPIQNPALADYAQQYLFDPGATVVILVILTPLVEETFFRGLLFGSLRQYSRPIAYILSVLLFCLYHVWQFAFVSRDMRYLLLAVTYLPAGLALTWSYDYGGSVWSPVFLHMAISGYTLYSIVR